jgi:hypothetical protein
MDKLVEHGQIGYTVMEDQSSELPIEDLRTKLLTLDIITALTEKFSDHDSEVREAAINFMDKIVEYGQFNRQVREKIRHLNL